MSYNIHLVLIQRLTHSKHLLSLSSDILHLVHKAITYSINIDSLLVLALNSAEFLGYRENQGKILSSRK